MIIFGLDETGKKLKKAFEAAGADPAAVGPWLKLYNQVRKNAAPTEEHYRRVKEDAGRILGEAKELEEMLMGFGSLSPEQTTRFQEILADYKATDPKLDYEFVVGSEDKDFHLTMQSIAALGERYAQGCGDPVILKSEVENLIAMAEERLEKEQPDLLILACFYRNHTDAEMDAMSYSSRLMYIEDCFRRDFVDPILTEGSKAIACAPALQEELKQGGWLKRRKAERLETLTGDFTAAMKEMQLEDAPALEQLTAYLKRLCIV